MRMPFTGSKVFRNNKNDKEIVPRHQKTHQTPENDYSKVSQR